MSPKADHTVHEFSAIDIDGQPHALDEYRG